MLCFGLFILQTHINTHSPSDSFYILCHNWKTIIKYVRRSGVCVFFSIEPSLLESSVIPHWTGWFLCYCDIFFLFCVKFLYQNLISSSFFVLFYLLYPFWYSTFSSRLLRNQYKRGFSFSRILAHLEMLIFYHTFNLQVGNYSPQYFESIILLAFSFKY